MKDETMNEKKMIFLLANALVGEVVVVGVAFVKPVVAYRELVLVVDTKERN